MNGSSEKKHLGALDIMIIILILAVFGSVAFRYLNIRNSDVASGVQLDNYIITFEISDIRDSSARNYLETGTNFYFDDNDQFFGTLREGKTIQDAAKFYELSDGEIVYVSTDVTGELYRVDVEASVTAKGKIDADGRFLLDGSRYVGLNREVKIYSKYVSYTVLITGITKAQ